MKEIKNITKEFNEILKKLIKRINLSKNIAIIGHINPDGDCIGAQMGLFNSLQSLGKNVDIINEGPFKGIYRDFFEKYFIKTIEKDYDLYIIVDATDKLRTGELNLKIDFEKTIVIDHHITNDGFGKYNWVSDKFISTCEMVFLLLLKMKVDFRNTEIPQYLLNGLLADNGYYQHIRTHKYLSLLISYLMIQQGADPKKSYDLMFCNKTINTEQIFSLVLKRITPVCEGKILWSYLTEDDKKQFGNIDFESGILFGEMKSIKGSEIAVFFKVNEELKKVDISFRSNDNYDISKIASELGGGGHKVAAGVTVEGKFTEIKDMVFKKLENLINHN